MPALMAPLRPAHAPYTAGRWPNTLVKLATYPLASTSAAYAAATAPVGSAASGALIQLIGPVSLRSVVGTPWCRAGQVVSRGAARAGPGADHDGCAELLGRRDAWGQPAALERLGGLRGLTPARLDQQVTTGRQPERRIGGDPAVQVQAVGPAVQGGGGLVQPGLGRHQPDRVDRDVGRVRDQDVDASAQRRRQGGEQVALVHLPDAGQVEPCAPHGGGVDIGGMQLDLPERRRNGRSDGTGAAAEVDHDGRMGGAVSYTHLTAADDLL